MVRAKGAVVGLVLIAILAVPGAQTCSRIRRRGQGPLHALEPGQLRELLRGFHLDRYEEFRGLGGWSGPDTLIVRTVAVKQ